MSTSTRAPDLPPGLGDADAVRAVALGGIALLVSAYGSVFYHFIDVTGEPVLFLVVAAITLAAATTLSNSLRLRWAAVTAAGWAHPMPPTPPEP